MEIKDLVNRFELLEPNNQNLIDLRRSYIDKDLSSIFKLSNTNDNFIDIEDLRKAVIEENLHSLFRLFINYFKLSTINNTLDIEDLRKAMVEENLHSLFRIIGNVNTEIEDLRKTVVEKNLYSLFRVIGNVNTEIVDFRKAVTEKNLNSLFRLIKHEDLRKLVLEDNIRSLWKLLFKYTTTHFVAALKNFYNDKVQIDLDCLSQGQIKSKRWLVQELVKLDLDLGTIFLCAGWYATLSTMLFESGIKIDKIRSFDLDPTCVFISEVFNKPWVVDDWKFKSCTKNILDINYDFDVYYVLRTDGTLCELSDSPNTIINTSCEHIEDFDEWYNLIPKGKIVILQTNNYFEIEDHVNCSKSLAEFRLQSPMTTVLYEGELVLDKYTRYMRIGIK